MEWGSDQDSWMDSLNAFPIELGLRAGPVNLQGALLADRVRAVEDPVLPRREAAEDAGEHGLRAGEAQARLHAGKRIGRKARALLDGEADLVFPVELVRRRGDEAELSRGGSVEELVARQFRRPSAEAGVQPRQSIHHRIGVEIEVGQAD